MNEDSVEVVNATDEEVEYRITPLEPAAPQAAGGSLPAIDEAWMRRQFACDITRSLSNSLGWASSEELRENAEADMVVVAKAALAAAKVIYPEVDELPMTTEGGE